MKKLSSAQRKLIAEFLSNIGVAWFAGGVISIFVGTSRTPFENFLSIMWGITYSIIFLAFAMFTVKGVRR